MAYNYEYPYTDAARYNDDWLLKKMQELDQDLTSLEERVTAAAIAASKEYLDTQIDDIFTQFDELKSEVEILETELDSKYARFEREVSAQITLFDTRLSNIQQTLEAEILGVNARTDLAIAQNNEYIFQVISERLSTKLIVKNYFTGEDVTVQDMFDFLASLHVDDGITYTDIPGRNKTVTDMINLGSTITNLVLHANSLMA